MNADESIVIHANQSGRLWHDDPARWSELCDPATCPWCLGTGPPPDEILAETDACWVTAGVEGTVPGYVCVVSKIHAVEPYELDEAAQTAFWLDAMTVARGLAEVTQPVKMNYEIHGNTIPHLHMHLFPRMPQDPYVGYVITSRLKVTRTPEQLADMARAIRTRLSARGRLS